MHSVYRHGKKIYKTARTLSLKLITNPFTESGRAETFFEKAQRRRGAGKFDSITEKYYLEPARILGDVTPKYWYFYLKFIGDTKGLSQNLIEKCEHAIRSQKKTAPGLLAKYAILLNEAGQKNLAFEYYQQAKNLKPNVFDGYLAINAMVAEMYDVPTKELQEQASLFEKLKSHEDLFAKLIIENKNSFCIVGNSASEMSSGNGYKIDQHKLVIRFNNFCTKTPFDKDYGKKADIWVRSAEGSPVYDRDLEGFKLVMISGGNFINNNRKWKLINQILELGTPLGFFPNASWHELVARIQAPPSAGLLTLYSIYKLIGPIPRSAVYGFSFTDQLHNNHKAHYFDNAKAGIRHNWQGEREVFESLIEQEK